MKAAAITLSILALVVVFLAPTLHAAGLGSAAWSRIGMTLGTLVWFVTAPFWIRSGGK
jgi:hypothetical protein